ncbi:MAG: RNA-directed DNA polymerase, partial [Chloroflexi bacterium]|nr:RNA-directed DNA polymerase [Chloroflexota bacterium]
MSRLASLKAARTRADFARLLEFGPSELAYLLYVLPESQKYQTFRIRKRSGGERTIDAPLAGLKIAQRKLADLLQDCADEIEAASGRVDLVTHGFKRKHSIITNSTRHRDRRHVLNLNLEDFFPSINFGRVLG